ncbi:MAG TPA: MFS transporter [Lactobacillus sp.]|nr:MFS transporter [Lactobacillus sp.]
MQQRTLNSRLIMAIFATGLMSFAGVVVETAMNITFPVLMRQFHINTGTVQWLTTGYLLIVATFVPISSFLKRRFKTRNLFLTANLLFMSGLIVDSLAPSFSLLLLGRLIQGVATGIALPLMFNIILEQAPLDKIGLLMGIGTLVTAVAPALGPTYGGLIVSNLQWRDIFMFLIPLLLISLVMGLFTIRQVSETSTAHFDILSWVLIAATFVSLILGLSNMSHVTTNPWPVIIGLLIGLIALIAFAWRSNKIDHPLINLHVFNQPVFSWHLLAFFLLQITALGLSFLLPNFLQLVNGKSALVAGLVVLPGAALGALFAPLGGTILDHFGPARPILVGATCQFVAVFAMALLTDHLSAGMILSWYLLYMFGTGLAFGNIMTTGLKSLSDQQQSDGNAVYNTVQQFAGAVGTATVSAVVALTQSGATHTFTFRTQLGTQRGFAVLAGLLLINLFVLAYGLRLNYKQNND